MTLFIDTSALLKGYVVERRGSDVMREVLSRPEFEAGIFVSSTVILETYGCIARKWRRKIIDDGEFRTAWEEVRRDVDTFLPETQTVPELLRAMPPRLDLND